MKYVNSRIEDYDTSIKTISTEKTKIEVDSLDNDFKSLNVFLDSKTFNKLKELNEDRRCSFDNLNKVIKIKTCVLIFEGENNESKKE